MSAEVPAMSRLEAAPAPPAGAEGGNLLDWRTGGILLGLLATLAVALQGPIGVSTAYVTTEAAAVAAVSPKAASANSYWTQVGTSLTSEWVIVVGILIGGLVSALATRSRTREAVPASWSERFGPMERARLVGAFVGGFLLLFGARLAGGCTSGHIISGMSQLAVSGVIFAAATFASGIITARALYGGSA